MAAALPKLHAIQAAYGDCFLLQFNDGGSEDKYWLIDGGPGKQTHGGTFMVTNFHLFSTVNDVVPKELERVIVTHNDRDHTYGAYALLSSTLNPAVSVPREKVKDLVKFVSWKNGYKMVDENKKFPVTHTWFNDKWELETWNPPSSGDASMGWMDDLLATFVNAGVHTPGLNDDWDNLKNVVRLPEESRETLPTFDNIKMLGPTAEMLRNLLDHDGLKTSPPEWKVTAQVYANLEKANKANFPTSIDQWYKVDAPNFNGRDTSPTNLSSIVFEFQQNGKSIFMGADAFGPRVGDEYIFADPPVTPPEYHIFKLLHHGSSNNNVLYDPAVKRAKSKLTKVPLAGKFFFQTFKAQKYVVSSDALNVLPNADVDCIKALADAYSAESSPPTERRRLYLTNGMSPGCWKAIKWSDSLGMARTTTNKLRTFVMRHNGPDYGTVVASDPSDNVAALESSWQELGEETSWGQYHVVELIGYYDHLKKPGDAGKTPLQRKDSIMRELGMVDDDLSTTTIPTAIAASSSTTTSTATLPASPPTTPTTPVTRPPTSPLPAPSPAPRPYNTRSSNAPLPGSLGSRKRFAADDLVNDRLAPVPVTTPVVGRTRSRISATLPTRPKRKLSSIDEKRTFKAASPSKTTANKSTSFMAMAAQNPVAARALPTPLTWHDVMILNLLEVTDLTDEDMSDTPPPPAVPKDQVVIDGETENWVDLATFIFFLDQSNSQAKATPTRPSLDPSYIAMLKWYFLSPQDPTQPESTVVAAALLTALLTELIAAELFVALPLNANGPASAIADPFPPPQGTTATTLGTTAIRNSAVENFRARIIVPSAADLLSGAGTFEVVAFYFELDRPPVELNNISTADFFTWTIPFNNGVWQAGQATFQHTGPLRVKMLWPFYQNAITFCHFDANFELSRDPNTPSLPVVGTMCMTRGNPASYDIQIANDTTTGDRKVTDMLQIFLPSQDLATSLLGGLASYIDTTVIDFTKILQNDLRLQDVGVILRQHRSGLAAVSIDDLYGTLSTSGLLQMATSALPFPTAFSIPTNLPSLTMTLTNIAGSTGHTVSFAFSQHITDIGVVALQISRGPDAQSRFDVWSICDGDVSLGTILQQLDFDSLTSAFQGASVFDGVLSDLFVPYVHVTVAPKGKYDPSQGYSVQQVTAAIEFDDKVSLPSSDNPIITLENVSFEIMASLDGSNPTSMSLYGTATIKLGNYDAICTFSVDHDEDAVKAFLAEDSTSETASTSSNSSGGFQGILNLSIQFPNDQPRVGDIINEFLNEVVDATGLNSLEKNIPSDFFAVLDMTDFQELKIRLEKSAATNNKWSILYLYIQVRLDGLQNVLNILPTMSFDIPVLDLVIHYPSDPTKKAYQVNVSTLFGLNAGTCQLSASFDSPPAGFVANTESYISVSLTAEPEHEGLPIGPVVEQYVGRAMDDLGVNVGNLVPASLQDAIQGITIDEAMISFVNEQTKSGSSNWHLKWVEVAVTSQKSWTPFTGFTITNAQVHFAHDTGAGIPATASTTQVEVNATLTFGKNPNPINVGFTHDSASGASTFSFQFGQSINLLTLITDGIQDMGLEIPSMVANGINSIQINTDAFYISYSEGNADNAEALTFSNDGTVSILGASVTNISVICSRPVGGGSWSYTVSLAMETPCTPLAAFCSVIPGLDGIIVENGKFAFFDGTVSSTVLGQALLPPLINSESVMLAGSLLFQGSAFMDLVHSIVQIPQVDFAMLRSGLKMPITSGSTLNIMDIFIVESFNFEIISDGFGIGATIGVNVDWLSKKRPVEGTFFLQVQGDGGIGASASITEIDEPFGLPGISLMGAAFSIVWLIEANAPQSLGASGSVAFTEQAPIDPNNPPDTLSGSFAFSVDATNPTSNFFNMELDNITLPDMVNTMTFGHNPPPLDVIMNSKVFKMGFKLLKIDLVPSSTKFTFNADFYVASLEGKVAASVETTQGIAFSAYLDPIDIIGLVQINSSHSTTQGPFVFVDTTIPGSPPPWTGVPAADDPAFKGAVFAMSGSLVFIGISVDVYGLVNLQGLQLIVSADEKFSVPGVDFSVDEQFGITIDSSQLQLTANYEYSFGFDTPDISIAGISLGSFGHVSVDLENNLSLTVRYNITGWENDGLIFFVNIVADVADIPGFSIDEKLTLDASLTNIEQLPGKIEAFVIDQVTTYLKNSLAAPFILGWDEAKEAASKAIATLVGAFNAVASDVLNILSAAGHDIAAISDGLKNTLNLSIDEVASALVDFGHDINDIGNILSDVFAVGPSEIASGLTSAGVTVEHAFEVGFGEIGGELSKDFTLVGNSVAGFAGNAVDVVDHFVVDDVENTVSAVVTDIGNALESAADAVGNWFSSW